MHMVQRMNKTGHLGVEFIHGEHISIYASGTRVSMTDEKVEQRLIGIDEDGPELATLFTKSLFPQKFGTISKTDANAWL